MSVITRLSVVLSMLFFLGCTAVEGNPNGSPQATDFDQSCLVDEDCIVVRLFEACGCSEHGAVHKGERGAVDAANAVEDSYQDTCTVVPFCLPCNTYEAMCDTATNLCVLQATPIPENQGVSCP